MAKSPASGNRLRVRTGASWTCARRAHRGAPAACRPRSPPRPGARSFHSNRAACATTRSQLRATSRGCRAARLSARRRRAPLARRRAPLLPVHNSFPTRALFAAPGCLFLPCHAGPPSPTGQQLPSSQTAPVGGGACRRCRRSLCSNAFIRRTQGYSLSGQSSSRRRAGYIAQAASCSGRAWHSLLIAR